jgi:Alpha galactosidase A
LLKKLSAPGGFERLEEVLPQHRRLPAVLCLVFSVGACGNGSSTAPGAAGASAVPAGAGGAAGSGGLAGQLAAAGSANGGCSAGGLSNTGGDAPMPTGGDANLGRGASEPVACHAFIPGVALLLPRPPMGWSSVALGCAIDEGSIKQVADTLFTSGLRDAGYRYVVVDDCWQTTRGADGSLGVDAKFPGGLKGLADYLHAKQLKLGLGSSRGPTTCNGRPGSEGHEVQDVATFAAAGVDYAAINSCNGNPAVDARRQQFTTLISAFAAKSLALSIEPYADGQDLEGFEQWMQTANVFRNRGGISDSWASIVANVDSNADGGAYGRVGSYNDPGMLLAGGKLSETEYRAQLSLWAVMAAPLIASVGRRQQAVGQRHRQR